MADVVGIINQGLRDGGVPFRVNDVYEGSEAARTALEVYQQTRDEILRLNDYSFSRRVLALTLLKGPPPPGGYTPQNPWSALYPAPGFLYEYAYPGDCLDLRAILAQPFGMPDLDPRPEEWQVQSDPTPIVSGTPPAASGPAAKVILCQVNNAIATYRARVTDPNEWDAGFTAAVIAELGDKFATAFGVNPSAAKERKTEAIVARQVGDDVRG